MDNSSTACPVCTLFLREGVTLQAHLETHPKDQVIEALMRVSSEVSTSQPPETPASTSSYIPEPPLASPNPFIQQSPQALLLSPQPQMTTAVTYQHFMSSNGSTLMPQYIQIPAIVNAGSSIPIISNPVNLVPNPAVNYSQTAYNPLYNPYIPQPYPFTQPVVTNFPSGNSNTQAPGSSSSQNQSKTLQKGNVLVKKCSVSTSTDADKNVSKAKPKKLILRHTPTRRKVRMLKFKSDSSRLLHKINYQVVKSSTRLRAIKPKMAASSNPGMISPPPLTLGSSTNNGLTSDDAPPPPPLSKAPCFDIINVDKGEDVTDSAPSSVIAVEQETPFADHESKSKDADSEVLYSNIVEEDSQSGGGDVMKIFTDCTESQEMEIESPEESQKDPLGENVGENASGRANEDEEQEEEEEEKQEKIFEMITEETKIDITAEAMSQDIPSEISSQNIERNCDGSDIFIQEENILLSESSDRERSDNSELLDLTDAEKIQTTGEKLQEYEFHSDDSNSSKRSPVTYTDLQPAKSTKVYEELDISPYLNFSNYMEVNGIKIFFNNSSSRLSFDPLMKLTGIQSSGRCALKTENQVTNQSVIQIVSGEGDSKSDITVRENYRATTSQISDVQLDLPDLSPVPLNIQTDETMPARGELSEQESLGAENSSWNLFHRHGANEAKTLEEWRNDTLQSTPPALAKRKVAKSFKCSICNEVFSCPKERRVHKNTVHSGKAGKGSSSKNRKKHPCSFCSEVFATLRDRKAHVLELHNSLVKGKESAEVKVVTVDGSPVKNEDKEDKVKTEKKIPRGVMEPLRVKYCSRCSLPFLGVKKLRQHLRLEHGEVKYKCETCSECFDEEHEFNEHLQVHPLVCDQCGKIFRKRANMNLHKKRHLTVKPFECSVCPKSFITRQKLMEHLNGHTGKKPIKCNLCDKTFSRHSNLIQHRKNHHLNFKKKVKDYICRCGEVFHSLRKLEWHKEVHEPRPRACPFCSQKFIHSSSVTRHIRKAHLPDYLPGSNREVDNVQCPICEKVYLRSSLGVHMRVHNGEKPFPCKICSKSFTTKWNLELHGWTHQSRSNMPFKCTVCKSAFFRESDFVAHVNAHRNYRPFTCNICGQKFIRKYTCLRHQEEHKKSKQYVCGMNGCAKSFHRGYYLRDHMKVHTGLRPHTCHICGKASSTKSNHNKHVRIHDSREPINTEN